MSINSAGYWKCPWIRLCVELRWIYLSEVSADWQVLIFIMVSLKFSAFWWSAWLLSFISVYLNWKYKMNSTSYRASMPFDWVIFLNMKGRWSICVFLNENNWNVYLKKQTFRPFLLYNQSLQFLKLVRHKIFYYYYLSSCFWNITQLESYPQW